MSYDKYLSEGYPIGSGVVESACSHVVKDRTEISGARRGDKKAQIQAFFLAPFRSRGSSTLINKPSARRRKND